VTGRHRGVKRRNPGIGIVIKAAKSWYDTIPLIKNCVFNVFASLDEDEDEEYFPLSIWPSEEDLDLRISDLVG